jgi:Transposase IS200 like
MKQARWLCWQIRGVSASGSAPPVRRDATLGVRRQAAWKGVQGRTSEADGGNLGSVCADFEVELKEFNGEADHVHLLVNFPPKVRLSELVQFPKGRVLRRMKQEFPAISTFWSVRKNIRSPRVSELFRRLRGRCPDHHSPAVHRGPEPAFGRCVLNPGPKGPGTSRFMRFSGVRTKKNGYDSEGERVCVIAV